MMSVPVRAKRSSAPSDSPHGLALLRDPLLNKGTAFTEAERDALGLRGFLPAHVLSMKDQVERVLTNLRSLPTDLEIHVSIAARPQRTLFSASYATTSMKSSRLSARR
jgi:malate dehydrogenase (oxaloacetate-decarboxylating)(NADP+)